MPSPKATGIAALGGPIDEKVPLYTRVAAVAAEHPGESLPRSGDPILGPHPEIAEPIGPVEAGTDRRRRRLHDWQLPRLVRSLRWYFDETTRDRPSVRRLCDELIGVGGMVAHLAVEATAPGRDPEAARHLGSWLARRGTHRGQVHVGLWLLAEAGTAADREVISTLGLVESEFNPAAVQALRATQPDPHRAVFELARRVEGWGRVYAVEALKGTTEPEIKRWMVREASGDWGLIYYCHTLATTGDLLSALREGPVDDKLLDGAGAILEQLCAPDVQTTGIGGYPDARAVLASHQRFVSSAAGTLVRLHHLVELEKSVQTGRASRLDWTEGEREAVVDGYAAILDAPVWRDVVETELANPQSGRRYFASRHARRVGFDITARLLDELTSGDPDGGLCWDVLGECEDERLPGIIAALRVQLGHPPGGRCAAIARRVLLIILPRLIDSPGLGDDLVDHAAASTDPMLGGRARRLLRGRT